MPAGGHGDASGPPYLRIARRAMACDFEVILNPLPDAGLGTEAALEALELVSELETQLSWYRPDSDVSRCNRLAASQSVRISWPLWSLLEEALQMARETGGAFDITSTPLSRVWGFLERRARHPSREEIEEARACVGSHHILLDARDRSVRFARPGVEINLGSIGKGYALDRAAEILLRKGIADFLIHGGQSSVLARGSSVFEERGWVVGLAHPSKPGVRLGTLRLADQAIGTSGSGRQYFYWQGKRLGHILDPRTGYPARQCLSVSVLAPTARQADAWATAFFVMGPEEAARVCRRHPELGAIFLVPGRRSASLRCIVTGNVPPEQWDTTLEEERLAEDP